MSKCFQAIGKLKLNNETPPPGQRPKALGMMSCVGEEYVPFKTPLPLLNKVRAGCRLGEAENTAQHTACGLTRPGQRPQVEVYMTEVVSKMRGELRDVLRDSVVDYTTKPRDKWLFDWPSQIILVVNQVFWCQEVEQVCVPVKEAATVSSGRLPFAWQSASSVLYSH